MVYIFLNMTSILSCFNVILYNTNIIIMAHSYRLGFVTWGYQVRIPVYLDIVIVVVHTVNETVQKHGVYSAAYGTVQ